MKFFKCFLFIFLISAITASCSKQTLLKAQQNNKNYTFVQNSLYNLLQNENHSKETRYAIVNRIANNMLSIKDYNSLILFLTDWVEKHPDDSYNCYWLLMTAFAYLETDAKPMALYYFERIINN